MISRNVVLIDAPSNLGMRPPFADTVPGVYKLPGALRDCGLLRRLHAIDGGVVAPPRYVGSCAWEQGGYHADVIADFSHSLADRLLCHDESFKVVLGGDCSILLGVFAGLAENGRFGLLFADAHSGFHFNGAAGEDLAILSGLGDTRLTNLTMLYPMIDLQDVVLVGVRDDEALLPYLSRRGAEIVTSAGLDLMSPERAGRYVVNRLTRETLDGFWIHFDADVIDASEMPAVDSPEAHGPSVEYMTAFLRTVIRCGKAAGISVTMYDPDRDEGRVCANRLVEMLVNSVGQMA